VGPGLIAADAVDQAKLRIRTWHNGELVQDDTTGDLLFPLARLVADLSQLLTLEEGDIILTGTPAAASVAKPGNVVEVEVSAGELTGADWTTGRLVTRVEEGTTPFADFGARPRTDDLPREEAYGSREAAGIAAGGPVLSLALKAKLESVCTATLSSQLRKRGLNNVSIDGRTSTRPDKRIVGLARTLRCVPNREGLFWVGRG
jgi:5-oxopent-3-ene-1,2,5-tricarboxylate decarboxylase / 2-hydroxyhepta-2,4-diene-1,7-dioate isomerase